MEEATKRLWYWLDAVDASCNRFRDDSELSRLNDSHGATMRSVRRWSWRCEAALLTADVTGTWSIPPSCPRCSPSATTGTSTNSPTATRFRELASVPVDGTVVDPPRLDEHTVRLTRTCQLDLGAERQGAPSRNLIAG